MQPAISKLYDTEQWKWYVCYTDEDDEDDEDEDFEDDDEWED